MRRQALVQPRALALQARPTKFPPPVGGWRADVPVGDMPPNAAFSLVNWFPETGFIRVRNGFAPYSSQFPASVETIIPYSGSSIRLFAAAGANIYEVTGGGGTVSTTGFTNSHVSYSQISTAGGKFLTVVNGYDPPQQFDGSAWSAMSATGGPASLSSLSVITTYRERLWFLEKGTTYLWYLPTQSIAGAMNYIDVGADMARGGTLVALGVWTAEVYSGVIEFLVIVTSEGDVLVFQGSNPADSTNWSLLGTFKLSPPLGTDRCIVNIGGDLAIMTNDAVIPISKAIQLDPAASDVAAVTARIAPAWLDIVQNVGVSTPGWQFSVFPRRRMAIVNVPDPAGIYQLVMNTETKAWCQFEGMASTCWAIWENNLYFGTADGYVMQADYGSNDNGAAIVADMVGAWARGDGVSQKQPTIVTLDMNFGLGASIFAGANVDYDTTAPTSPANPINPVSAAAWDVAEWDVDTWPGSAPNRLMAAANCRTGAVVAPVVRVLLQGETGQQSDCYLYGGVIMIEPGGPI